MAALESHTVQHTAARPSPSGPWLISPATDLCLLVAAPLAIVPAASLAGRYLSPEQIFLLVAAFASIGHHLPGFLRAYGDRELFARFRWRFLLAPPVALTVALAFSMLGLHGLELLLLLWATWHIMMQTYGFMRIYDLKRGRRDALTARLDFLLCGAVFLGGIVFSEARVFGIAEIILRMGLPLPSPAWLIGLRWGVAILAGVVTVAFAANSLRHGIRGVNPIKLLLVLATAWLYWICGSLTTNLLIGVAMFEVFHALQYYAIVWTYNRRLADRVGERFGPLGFLFRNRWFLLPIYIALIAAFGSLKLFSEGVHHPMTQQILLAVLAASTMLHFYYDGFIWKVSQRNTQQNLGIEDSQAKPAADPAGWPYAFRWGGVFAAVCVLLVWEYAGIDHPSDLDTPDINATLASWTPQLPELQARISQQALQSGDTQQAIESARRAVQLRPRSHEAQAALGVALLHAGQFPQAAEHLQKATELAPHLWENYHDLGQALAKSDRWEEAERAFAEASRLQPKNADVQLAWGRMAAAQSGNEAALPHFRRAVDLDPSSVPARLAMVEALTDMGEVESAIQTAKKGVALEPRSADSQLCLGKALAADKQWDAAAECFQKAVDLEPRFAEAYVQLGTAQVQLADFPRAESALQTAIDLEPKNGLAHFQLGNANLYSGNLAGAERSYRRCLALLPDLADAHNNLGSVLFQRNDTAAAAEAYRNALDLKPQNGPGHYNLGLILITQNKLAEAKAHVQRAMEAGIAPSPEVAELLGL